MARRSLSIRTNWRRPGADFDPEDIPNCVVGLLKRDELEESISDDHAATLLKGSAVVKVLLPSGWSGEPSQSSETPKQSAAKDTEEVVYNCEERFRIIRQMYECMVRMGEGKSSAEGQASQGDGRGDVPT